MACNYYNAEPKQVLKLVVEETLKGRRRCSDLDLYIQQLVASAKEIINNKVTSLQEKLAREKAHVQELTSYKDLNFRDRKKQELLGEKSRAEGQRAYARQNIDRLTHRLSGVMNDDIRGILEAELVTFNVGL